jgi:hypothetical protein
MFVDFNSTTEKRIKPPMSITAPAYLRPLRPLRSFAFRILGAGSLKFSATMSGGSGSRKQLWASGPAHD